MNEILQRLQHRFKKWIIPFILIPILAAGIAYLFQKVKASHTPAAADVQLATYDPKDIQLPNFTDMEYAKEYITSPAFLNRLHAPMSADEISQKMTLTNKQAKIVNLTLSGSDQADAKKTLGLIVKQYVKDSDAARQTIISNYQNAKTEAGPGTTHTKSEYDLKILGTKSVIVINPAAIPPQIESGKEIALLGFLVGIMMNIAILFIPEVLRD